MAPDLFCFPAYFPANRFNKLWIPSRPIVQRRREQRSTLDHQPHQTLLVGDRRYAQPGFLDKKLLQGVKRTHPFFGIDGMRAEWSGDLPDSQSEHFFYIVRGRSLAKGIGTNPMIAVGRQNQ